VAIVHNDKEKVVTDYFSDHLGSVAQRGRTFNWEALGYVPRDLLAIEAPFTQEEIKETINSMPLDKAPGPDGFTGLFFKTCWEIIKDDITVAINSMFLLNSQGFERLNSANIILLPKKSDATCVTDFRPINLIHSVAKIFTKLLANRLALILDSLVSKCQSAFIKKRSIQDNFLYVQNVVHTLQKQKLPAIFLKLRHSQGFRHGQLALPLRGNASDWLRSTLA
jgi:hypothetical protein